MKIWFNLPDLLLPLRNTHLYLHWEYNNFLRFTWRFSALLIIFRVSCLLGNETSFEFWKIKQMKNILISLKYLSFSLVTVGKGLLACAVCPCHRPFRYTSAQRQTASSQNLVVSSYCLKINNCVLLAWLLRTIAIIVIIIPRKFVSNDCKNLSNYSWKSAASWFSSTTFQLNREIRCCSWYFSVKLSLAANASGCVFV